MKQETNKIELVKDILMNKTPAPPSSTRSDFQSVKTDLQSIKTIKPSLEDKGTSIHAITHSDLTSRRVIIIY